MIWKRGLVAAIAMAAHLKRPKKYPLSKSPSGIFPFENLVPRQVAYVLTVC